MFRREEEVKGFVGYFYQEAVSRKEELVKLIAESLATVDTNEESLSIVKNSITTFVTECQGEYAEAYPQYLLSLEGLVLNDAVSMIAVTVRTKLNSTIKYSEKGKFKVQDSEFIADFVINALVQIYYREFAQANLQAVTEVFKEIQEQNNLPYAVEFTYSDKNYLLAGVDEGKVIFGGTIEGSYLRDVTLFETGDEYIDNRVAFTKEKITEALLSLPTIPLLLKNTKKVPVIGVITEQPTVRKRPDKLIAQVHGKLDTVRTDKEKIVTVEKEINGEKIFAVVKKNGDDIKEVLSPFNVETGVSVEVALADLMAE